MSFFARGDLPPFSTQSRQTGFVRQATVLTLARPLCPASACVKTFVRALLLFPTPPRETSQRSRVHSGICARLEGPKLPLVFTKEPWIQIRGLHKVCTKHAIDNMALSFNLIVIYFLPKHIVLAYCILAWKYVGIVVLFHCFILRCQNVLRPNHCALCVAWRLLCFFSGNDHSRVRFHPERTEDKRQE